MIAEQTQRAEHHGAQSARALGAQVIAAVRLQPRIAGAAAPALIDDCPVVASERRGGQARARVELFAVRVPLRHRQRNAVGGEDDARGVAELVRQAVERLARVRGDGVDEPGTFVPVADVRHLDRRGPLRVQQRARFVYVLAVLQAAGVAALRGGEKPDRAPQAGTRHLRHRVLQERMPVAHAHAHGQRDVARDERRFERARLRDRQVRERRDAAEPFVVMRDLLHAFGRDAPSAQNVPEKRAHVRRTLRSAERDQKDRVEGAGHSLQGDTPLELAAIIRDFVP